MKAEFQLRRDEATSLFKKVNGREPLTGAEAGEAALTACCKQRIEKRQTVFLLNKSLTCEVIQKNTEGKESLSVTTARYTGNFSIALSFSLDGKRLVNFLLLFEKYVKKENIKYFAPERFRKFIQKNGNVYRGRNEDVN